MTVDLVTILGPETGRGSRRVPRSWDLDREEGSEKFGYYLSSLGAMRSEAHQTQVGHHLLAEARLPSIDRVPEELRADA